jgi:uncharacterized membrane protein YebE (DUF533 family)
MKIRTTFAAIAMIGSIAASTVAASAAITLYAGAQLTARMNQSISSSNANVGDTFSMTVVPPYPSGNQAFQGATITGVITSVRRAGQGTKPQINLQLQYLRLSNGEVANIAGTVTNVQQKSSTANSVGKTALGALGGMLVGNAIGKTVFHASGGGAVGLIGGALLGSNSKENITIPQGSSATLQLSQSVTLREQASH